MRERLQIPILSLCDFIVRDARSVAPPDRDGKPPVNQQPLRGFIIGSSQQAS